MASLDRPLRIASGLLLLGVVLTFVGSLATIPMNGVGSTDRTAWVLAHLLLVLGAVATLVGLPAIYTPRDRVGWLGLLGFGLLFVGYLGVGFFSRPLLPSCCRGSMTRRAARSGVICSAPRTARPCTAGSI